MSFFNSFFGKKASDQPFDPDFEQLVMDTAARYLCEPGAEIDLGFKDAAGNSISSTHALPEQYKKCKTIQSVWDKRGVLYEAFDHMFFMEIEPWMRLERFIYDRYPQKAMQYIQQATNAEMLNDPDFATSFSRLKFFLAEYEQAIKLAKIALKAAPNYKRALLALADAEHLNGNHETAHEIYGVVLKSVMDGFEKESISVTELVAYHNDLMHSSVYAVAMLSDSQAPEITWNQVAEEFYHCPYFRTMHAFYLIKKGDNLKGIVKLISTSQEFSWYKDAVLNAHSSIIQFRRQSNDSRLWKDELSELQKVMDHYNWTPLVS